MLWGLLRSNMSQTLDQCKWQKFVVIKLLLIDQGCRTDLEAELRPEARMLGALKLEDHKHLGQVTVTFFTNQALGTGDFLRIMSLWYIYAVLIGWVIQLWQGNLPHVHVWTCQPGCQLPMYISLSQTGWQLPREILGTLTPIQNESFI